MHPKLNQEQFLGEIVITQVGRSCVVSESGKQTFIGGRVSAKRFAKDRHNKTGLPIYNIKSSGNKVLVTPAK